MYPQTIKLRVDAKDVELWKSGAKMAGLTLSEWVRRKCNGEEITTKPWTPKEEHASVVGKRRSGSGDSRGVSISVPSAKTEVVTEINRVSNEVVAGGLGPSLPEQRAKLRKCSHGVTEGFKCWVCGSLAKAKE